MASAIELRQWTEKSNTRQQKLLLALLAIMLAALLLSQPVTPLVPAAPVFEPVDSGGPAAPVAEKAVAPLLAEQAFEPLALEAEVGGEPAEAAVVEQEQPSREIPVGVSSWYGNQSPYAGKPLNISGGAAGVKLVK